MRRLRRKRCRILSLSEARHVSPACAKFSLNFSGGSVSAPPSTQTRPWRTVRPCKLPSSGGCKTPPADLSCSLMSWPSPLESVVKAISSRSWSHATPKSRAKKTKEFTTVENFQTSIDIPIYEGERQNCNGNHLLGEFTIRGIERAKKGEAKIDVTFEVNTNGLLKVSAVDRKTGVEAKVEITHDRGRLSPEEIAKLQAEAAAFAEADELRAKQWREQHGHDEDY
mmetsp:Transcript_10684/g.20481  ORF Transcript_10684/g.20481 Transcript_10684/m.20481 type:complete len:225 (-) Transcript_10684:538-1212(-)